MMRILLFAVFGMAFGYYAGAYVSCTWLSPDANLCGLTGVFITGPIGALVGGLFGWWLQRRRHSGRRSHEPG
jgi:membrane associated rhomboid family serine protease